MCADVTGRAPNEDHGTICIQITFYQLAKGWMGVSRHQSLVWLTCLQLHQLHGDWGRCCGRPAVMRRRTSASIWTLEESKKGSWASTPSRCRCYEPTIGKGGTPSPMHGVEACFVGRGGVNKKTKDFCSHEKKGKGILFNLAYPNPINFNCAAKSILLFIIENLLYRSCLFAPFLSCMSSNYLDTNINYLYHVYLCHVCFYPII